MPLLGLVPVVVAVVLASEGRLGGLGGSPSLGAPATSTAVAALAGPPAATQAAAAQAPAAQAPAAQAPAAQAPAAQARSTATPAPTTAAQATAAQTAAPQQAGQAAAPSGAATTPGPNSGAGLFRAYQVQPGDTVKFVAQMFGVSPASVSQASGLQNPDQLRVGQVLTVPIQPGWLYRVQSGETLDQIAARTGVASAVIVSASKLSIDAVQPGDVILIPDQSATFGK